MATEIQITGNKENPRIFFAFCLSCFDINEETGDPQNGYLQLSGDGATSLDQAIGQADKHKENNPTHRTKIDCI